MSNNIFLRWWNWCCRFRHRCGYGVHSPSDFFLITFVIYEKLSFYAYDRLKEYRHKCTSRPEHREKVDRLLLRLVNFFQYDFLLEIGTGTGISTTYMAEGNKKMKVISCSDNPYYDYISKYNYDNNIIFNSEGLKGFVYTLENSLDKPDLIHIANTLEYKEAFEAVLPYVSSKTCIIVSLPYLNRDKKKWWKEVVNDKRTVITFDLYDIGLVFFDTKRIKEHRVVNFL